MIEKLSVRKIYRNAYRYIISHLFAFFFLTIFYFVGSLLPRFLGRPFIFVVSPALKKLAEENAPLELQSGAYGCSTNQIDGLCDLLNATEGVMGSEIIGAGLGGCVLALVRKESVDHVISVLNQEYYDKHNYPHSAVAYTPSSGSAIIY